MAKDYLVMMLVSNIVSAENETAAMEKAAIPFQYGAIPNVGRFVIHGVREAKLGDRAGACHDADAKFADAIGADHDVASERKAHVQGLGYSYWRGEETRECMGGEAWSVTIPNRQWRLPHGDHRHILHDKGLIPVTYFNSLEAAEAYICDMRSNARTILDWPADAT